MIKMGDSIDTFKRVNSDSEIESDVETSEYSSSKNPKATSIA